MGVAWIGIREWRSGAVQFEGNLVVRLSIWTAPRDPPRPQAPPPPFLVALIFKQYAEVSKCLGDGKRLVLTHRRFAGPRGIAARREAAMKAMEPRQNINVAFDP